MKKKEFIVIKGLSIKELITKVKEIKKEIAEMTMDKNMKKLKDLRAVGKKRREVAQVLTLLAQKKLLEKLTPKAEEKKVSKTK